LALGAACLSVARCRNHSIARVILENCLLTSLEHAA
jgi:hypothetical protein